MRSDIRKKIEQLLAQADITIGGTRAWDIQVHNRAFYARVLSAGSLGLGETYMNGWWDCERLDQFFHKVLSAHLHTQVKTAVRVWDILKAHIFNLQKSSRAFRVGQHHYDIGNNLYQHMLDRRMIYSCAYWNKASTLDQAQEAKLDLVFRKLDLQPGMRLLDIGCGWGGTARFAAERYRVHVVGITVSEKQAAFARERCRGLPVEIRLQDYRDVQETFDRVVSLGMFEHVGYKNYKTFMRTVMKCLNDQGLFLLQTIGGNTSVTCTDPWIGRYIFPNSMLPSATQICAAINDLFVLLDWHCFGRDYDTTLMHWYHNFNRNWHALKKDYDERFYRMWKYYLLSCAGAFRAGSNQLWQIVLCAGRMPEGYRAMR